MSQINKEIGKKIRELRKERKLTMRELGERLGVTHAHISKMESGINRPSVELLEKIAEFFHVDITYFFTNENETSIFNDDQRELFFERNLTPEKLKKKYNLIIDGKPATDEEIEEMIKHIKIFRIIKKEGY